jgi:hypothetical protein
MCAADIDPPKECCAPSDMRALKSVGKWCGAVPEHLRRAGIAIWATFTIGGEQVSCPDPVWSGRGPFRYSVDLQRGQGLLGWRKWLELRIEATGNLDLPPLVLDCITAGRPRTKVMDLTAKLLKDARKQGSLVLKYSEAPEWQRLEKEGYAPRFALSLQRPTDADWIQVKEHNVVEM